MDESITHNTNSGLTLPDTRGSVGRASRGASAIFQDGGTGTETWLFLMVLYCKWTKDNRSFYQTSVRVYTSIRYHLMHSQTHLGAFRCGQTQQRDGRKLFRRPPQRDWKNSCERSRRPPCSTQIKSACLSDGEADIRPD